MYVKIYIYFNEKENYFELMVIVDKYINTLNISDNDMTNIAAIKYKNKQYKLYCVKNLDDALECEEELIKFNLYNCIFENTFIRCFNIYEKYNKKSLFNFVYNNSYEIMNYSKNYNWCMLQF